MTTLAVSSTAPAETAFGPENPFYAPSTLPYQAPPFDKINDSHYQPAIEAGIAAQLEEIRAIATNPAPPDFENTLVALEKTGQLLQRTLAAFNAVSGANTNPTLQKIEEVVAPRLAALYDALYLDPDLFARVAAIYAQREALHLDSESKRLLEIYYDRFVHAGANLSEADKATLRKLNEEQATLSNEFRNRLLTATREGAYSTLNPEDLAGFSEAQLAAAALTAKDRNQPGWVLPLQNTTQQPALVQLKNRATRQALFERSWQRTERGDANDTRDIVARLAQLRAQKAALLGYPTYAAWKLQDQMAGTPAAAIKFMDSLIAPAAAKARAEAADLQAVIDAADKDSADKDSAARRFPLQPWDWTYYAEQVRKAKYDLDEEQLRPYFELNSVLEKGVFYAATRLYGITFHERHDIPVYHPDVRVFEIFDGEPAAGAPPLALFYCDNFKRDNKNGGAWMSNFVDQSTLLDAIPVVYNVANFPKPPQGEPALITFTDVITLFHEFGHTLHGIFSATRYPSLSGTSVARDFVEFPSQFNEHWASDPAIFDNYPRDYRTGAPMPAELAAKIRKAAKFNQGYALTEVLAAARLDMEWHTLSHTLSSDAPLQTPASFEQAALEKTGLALAEVPPRYRSSYFAHIWGGGYAAGYYAYLWAEMLDHAGYQWFEDHGGLTRANGDRLRQMVLSRGNTADPAQIYTSWLGAEPSPEPMLKYRGLDHPIP